MAGRRGTVSAVGWAVVVLLALSHTAAQVRSRSFGSSYNGVNIFCRLSFAIAAVSLIALVDLSL